MICQVYNNSVNKKGAERYDRNFRNSYACVLWNILADFAD